MNAKISVFIIRVEAIIYLLLYSLHDCTFKLSIIKNEIIEVNADISEQIIKQNTGIQKPLD